MSKEKTIIKANSNFHHVLGENLFEKKDDHFKEYRRKWRKWPEKFYTGEFPLFIDIEVTSFCNLRCPFCATTFRDKEIKKGFISFDLVKKIIDEGAKNGLYGVKFNIRGEPLLHPDICEMVKYSKQKGLIDVYFNTNAMLLTGDMSKRLIDAGLDRISISFEGYTKEVYEKYRVGANYETVVSNIGELRGIREKHSLSYPKIRIQTVMLPELESTFKEYKKFWGQRADEVSFLDYKQMKVKKEGIRYPWACPQIWQRMAILWDGTILPCNHDDDARLDLGNIRESSVKEAWHSVRLNKIRQTHKAGEAHKIDACNGCYLRDSEILKLQDKK